MQRRKFTCWRRVQCCNCFVMLMIDLSLQICTSCGICSLCGFLFIVDSLPSSSDCAWAISAHKRTIHMWGHGNYAICLRIFFELKFF